MRTKPPLRLGSGRVLDFSGPALVMAVVNCNNDSFYKASGELAGKALDAALAAERDGAAVIDFGGESTRPFSSYISCEEEMDRVIPVISSFRERSSLPVSVDTRKAAVARAALEAGADIVNDISALNDDPEMAAVCAAFGAALVLVHKKGDPATMQEAPCYENLLYEIGSYLKAAADRAMVAGISGEKIIIDPGFGFGKTTEHNLEILRSLKLLAEISGKDYPLLVGLSRKNFIGEILGRKEAEKRLPGTMAANMAAIMGGADIIRVHDVKEHVDLAKMLFALRPRL